MLSARWGHFLDKPLEPIAKKIKITPNFFTIMGFIISAVAAITIVFNPRIGGFLILLGGIFDVFDGVVARTNGKVTEFGAFLDSVLDRYSDAFVFLAIAWYMYRIEKPIGIFLSLIILVGALLISYSKARAESLGMGCNIGLLERPERVIITSIACISGYILSFLWVLAILSHLTVLQRILYVKKQKVKDKNIYH